MANFDSLPVEIVSEILRYGTPQMLFYFGGVSKIWREYLNGSKSSEFIWKEVVLNDLGGEKGGKDTWRSFCLGTCRLISSFMKQNYKGNNNNNKNNANSSNNKQKNNTVFITNIVRMDHYKLLARYVKENVPWIAKENLEPSFTFAHEAFKKGLIKTVEVLLQNNLVNFTAKDKGNKGSTPIELACSNGRIELVELCVMNPDSGVDLSQILQFVPISSLLSKAAQSGNIDLFKQLLQTATTQSNLKSDSDPADSNVNPDPNSKLRELINTPNVKSHPSGQAVLGCAVYSKRIDMVQYLLSEFPDIIEWKQPLFIALSLCSLPILQTFVSFAKFHSNNNTEASPLETSEDLELREKRKVLGREILAWLREGFSTKWNAILLYQKNPGGTVDFEQRKLETITWLLPFTAQNYDTFISLLEQAVVKGYTKTFIESVIKILKNVDPSSIAPVTEKKREEVITTDEGGEEEGSRQDILLKGMFERMTKACKIEIYDKSSSSANPTTENSDLIPRFGKNGPNKSELASLFEICDVLIEFCQEFNPTLEAATHKKDKLFWNASSILSLPSYTSLEGVASIYEDDDLVVLVLDYLFKKIELPKKLDSWLVACFWSNVEPMVNSTLRVLQFVQQHKTEHYIENLSSLHDLLVPNDRQAHVAPAQYYIDDVLIQKKDVVKSRTEKRKQIIDLWIQNGLIDIKKDMLLDAVRDVEIASYLVSLGSPIDPQNENHNWPPLLSALERKLISLVQFYIDHGANVQVLGRDTYEGADLNKKYSALSCLLTYHYPHSDQESGALAKLFCKLVTRGAKLEDVVPLGSDNDDVLNTDDEDKVLERFVNGCWRRRAREIKGQSKQGEEEEETVVQICKRFVDKFGEDMNVVLSRADVEPWLQELMKSWNEVTTVQRSISTLEVIDSTDSPK